MIATGTGIATGPLLLASALYGRWISCSTFRPRVGRFSTASRLGF
jgi:hypothetical protein